MGNCFSSDGKPGDAYLAPLEEGAKANFHAGHAKAPATDHSDGSTAQTPIEGGANGKAAQEPAKGQGAQDAPVVTAKVEQQHEKKEEQAAAEPAAKKQEQDTMHDPAAVKACAEAMAGCMMPECGAVPIACVPDNLIANMLDHENGPASGLPYQVHYMGPPRPPCEEERMATVRAIERIDRGPDSEIDNILKLVQNIYKTPAALCALFDDKRVYISDEAGGVIPRGTFPWRWTLCGWSMAFKTPQCLVIEDTLQDARFHDNAKVTGVPGVRFYCGAPLVASNGHRLGTLCFADVKPRKFDAGSCMIMNNLSEMVVRQLEKGLILKAKEQKNQQLAASYQHLQRTLDCFDSTVVMLDVSVPGWKVEYVNSPWTKLTGLERDATVGKTMEELLEEITWSVAAGVANPAELDLLSGRDLPSQAMQANAKANQGFDVPCARLRSIPKSQARKLLALSFRPASTDSLDDSCMAIGVPAFLPPTGSDIEPQRFFFCTITTAEMPTGPNKTPKIMSGRSSLDSGSNDKSSWLAKRWGRGLEDLDGLTLGHLLGRGSFGRVYSGTWHGTRVAVKVIDHDIRAAQNGPGPSMEATLSQQLRHPHVLATLKYTVRSVPMATLTGSLLDSATSMARRQSTAAAPNAGTTPNGTLVSASVLAVGNASVTSQGHNSQAHTSSAQHAVQGEPAGPEEEGAKLTEGALAQIDKETPEDAGRWAVINFQPGSAAQTPDAAAMSAVLGCPAPPKGKTDSTNVVSGGNANRRPSCEVVSCEGSAGHAQTQEMMHETWMVLEYADRGALQDAMDRGWLMAERSCVSGRPNLKAILATAQEVASALQYMHSLDIVHGDLSAWNVLLCSGGSTQEDGGRGFVAKVADFGMSRLVSTKVLTRNYGTLTHMPPETLLHGVISKGVDVYSFGVLLWQMWTGSRPWCGMTHGQIVMEVANKGSQLKWPSPLPPSPFKDLATDCMSHNVERRPTMAEVVKRLQGITEDSTQDHHLVGDF